MDHRTRAFRKELHGADIHFGGEPWATYIHAADIDPVTPNIHIERRMT
jgi:hypothetical protein